MPFLRRMHSAHRSGTSTPAAASAAATPSATTNLPLPPRRAATRGAPSARVAAAFSPEGDTTPHTPFPPARWPRATQYAMPLCDLAHASHRCAPASAASAASASADLRFLLALNPAAAAAAAVADGAPSLLLRLVPEPRPRRLGGDSGRLVCCAYAESSSAGVQIGVGVHQLHRLVPQSQTDDEMVIVVLHVVRVRVRVEAAHASAVEPIVVVPQHANAFAHGAPFEARGAPPCVPFSPRARRTPAGT